MWDRTAVRQAERGGWAADHRCAHRSQTACTPVIDRAARPVGSGWHVPETESVQLDRARSAWWPVGSLLARRHRERQIEVATSSTKAAALRSWTTRTGHTLPTSASADTLLSAASVHRKLHTPGRSSSTRRLGPSSPSPLVGIWGHAVHEPDPGLRSDLQLPMRREQVPL